jgi:hypothetical protein
MRATSAWQLVIIASSHGVNNIKIPLEVKEAFVFTENHKMIIILIKGVINIGGHRNRP